MYTIYDTGSRKSNVHNLSHWWAISLTAFVFALSWFSKHRLLTLPTGLTVNDLPTHNESFIAERAWHDLNILTSFGTRPTGTHANEALAMDFFKREFSYIERGAHPNQKIYSDIQVVSGAYYINFKPHPMTNIYRNVQNFIVRLAGSDEAEDTLRKNHALMLNCHFDSVAGRLSLLNLYLKCQQIYDFLIYLYCQSGSEWWCGQLLCYAWNFTCFITTREAAAA